MLKKMTVLLAGVALMIGMVAGSAFAIPTLNTGYSWVNAPFWNFTDFTTGSNGNSDFAITLENAGYESDFGLYNVNNVASPTAVTTKFKVFSYNDEPGNMATVKLRIQSGQLQIALAGVNNWTNFDETFGFYYDVHTGGSTDTTADYSYYTLNSLNTPGQAQYVDHILTAFNPETIKTIIYLDDQILNPDHDWNDMTVNANDVAPAPVPEPATMVLLGTGMLGLAIFGKRRMNKE